ncbi:sulfotransferase [Smaragdicoccus niigatensis]|uniref:sulfotransferase n=1 Tax=Smaragdicoccus niigatensis TaxID=359359 RepID=UPI00138B0994|nr:sulfotransferase [Smaragdicoccus niigatensis]
MPSAPAKQVVVYIVGPGRSGSTLLELVLGSLSGFHNVGEIVEFATRGVLDDELCSCGTNFRSCDFWNEVGDVAFGGWTREQALRMFDLRWKVQPRSKLPATMLDIRHRRGPVIEYSAVFGKLIRAVAQVAKADVVVDASKLVTQAVALSASDDLDVRLLHLVRDARGVAYSWTKQDVARPSANAVFTEMKTHKPAASAARWCVDNALAEAIARRGLPYHRMRYEDFVSTPGPTVEAALRGLEIETPSGLATQLGSRTVHIPKGHALLGNPSGFGRSEVTLREDTGWRNGLGSRDRRLVTALSAPMLARYGYPMRSDQNDSPTLREASR